MLPLVAFAWAPEPDVSELQLAYIDPGAGSFVVQALIAMVAGVIASIRFRLVGLSAFDLITMLVLIAGGAGILLSSLRSLPRSTGD